jgi:hypothetical protein
MLLAHARRPLFAALLAALFTAPLLPGCDCDPDAITEINCDFEVSTPDGDLRIDFPQTAVGSERSRALQIENKGNTSLTRFDFAWAERNETHYTLVVPPGLEVAPGASRTLTLLFRPLAASTNLGASFVVSHAAVSGATCPVHRVQVDGASFTPLTVDAGPDDGGLGDGGPDDEGPDGGFPDAGPADAGTVTPPDGGVNLPPGSRFRARGAFQEARAGFAAVPLDDGSILAIGGYDEDGLALDSIERFDPRTGSSRIVARMAVPRGEPGAVRVPDDGRVVIVGGLTTGASVQALRLVEIYDPATNAVSCAPGQGQCTLADNADGVLPEGRYDPVVTAFSPGVDLRVAVLFGRTLDDGDEVLAAGGVLLTLGVTSQAAALDGAASLQARRDEVRVRRGDGALFVAGGRRADGTALLDMAMMKPPVYELQALTPAAPLTARAGAAGALLSTGDVLVAGGVNSAGFGVATMQRVTDVFDDDAGRALTVEAVPAMTLQTRFGPSFVTLPGDLVLLAGGLDRDPAGLSFAASVVPRQSAELFVPLAGGTLLRVAPDNNLAVPRYGHQAVSVTLAEENAPDEDVVVFLGGTAVAPRRAPHPQAERFRLPGNAFEVYGLMGPGAAFAANAPAALYSLGGIDPHTGSLSARVRAFDTETDTFFDAWSLDEPRREHSATLLADDNTFLVAGGRDASGQVLASASLYNPFNDFAEPLPVSLNRARAGHSATRLPDGTVLLCGGQGAGGEALDTCEVFAPPAGLLNPATYGQARFHLVQGRMSLGRLGHSATLLVDDNEVLLVGGGDVESALGRADLYEIAEGALRATGLPNRARRRHAVAYLGSGRVLLAGGETFLGGLTPTAEAEVYVRATETFVELEPMATARVGAVAIPLAGGDVLLVGGARPADEPFPTRALGTSELYLSGLTGIGSFESSIAIPLSYGRAAVAGSGEVFGRGLAAGGTHRDGRILSGDERHSTLYFVDELVSPDEDDADPSAGP